MRWKRYWVVFAFALSMLSCSKEATVTGSVFYRERMAMPPNAIVEVSLIDVSRADAKAVLLARLTIDEPGQVPVAFALSYDPSLIDERNTYQVQARILVDGRLAWISTTAHLVITRGNPSKVDVLVQRVPSPAAKNGDDVPVD